MVLYHLQKDLGILLELLVGPQVHKHLVHFLFFIFFSLFFFQQKTFGSLLIINTQTFM